MSKVLKIDYKEKKQLKNCYTIKFSLPDDIYMLPFSHSELAIINKNEIPHDEFIELLTYIYILINKYHEECPFNPDTLHDLEDLDTERKLVDRFNFDTDEYHKKLIPFNTIEVIEYMDDGSCRLLEIEEIEE